MAAREFLSRWGGGGRKQSDGFAGQLIICAFVDHNLRVFNKEAERG